MQTPQAAAGAWLDAAVFSGAAEEPAAGGSCGSVLNCQGMARAGTMQQQAQDAAADPKWMQQRC